MDLVILATPPGSLSSVTLLQGCVAEGGDGWLSPGLLILISITTYWLGTNRAPSAIQYTSAVIEPDVRQTFHLPQRELRGTPGGGWARERANKKKYHTRAQTPVLMLGPWVKHKEL